MVLPRAAETESIMKNDLLLPALLCLFGVSEALAQAPGSQGIPPAPPPTRSSQGSAAANAPMVDPYLPLYTNRNVYRSRTAPYPQHREDPDNEYGFRNPGGIGRMSEYYPPGNKFATGGDPVRVAGFSQGIPPGTSRADQLAAQQVGNQRMAEQDQRINALARPIGYGFGFGFGGFPY